MKKSKTNLEFGKATGVALSLYGPAFKTLDNTYLSYNKNTGDYIDVTDMLLTERCSLCYVMPVLYDELAIGDYIRHNGTWVRIVDFETTKQFDIEKLVDEEVEVKLIIADKIFEKERITILPIRNQFDYNNNYYYSKLICFADDLLESINKSNPFGDILPVILTGNSDIENENELLPFLLMSKTFNIDNPMMMYLLMKDSNLNLLPLLLMNQKTVEN